jgi:hypothetical protein
LTDDELELSGEEGPRYGIGEPNDDEELEDMSSSSSILGPGVTDGTVMLTAETGTRFTKLTGSEAGKELITDDGELEDTSKLSVLSKTKLASTVSLTSCSILE